MIVVVRLALLVGIVWSLSNPFAGMVTPTGINVTQPGELHQVFDTLRVERIEADKSRRVLAEFGSRTLRDLFAPELVTGTVGAA